MHTLWLLIACCCVQVPSCVVCHVVLKEIFNQTVYNMECLSDTDIIFKFKKKNSNTEIEVAACEKDVPTCYLYNQTIYAKVYAVTLTPQGGLFTIKEAGARTRGQYRCCELHTQTVCDSKEIGYPVKSKTQVNLDRTMPIVKTSEVGHSMESKDGKDNLHNNIPAVDSSDLKVAIVMPHVVLIVVAIAIAIAGRGLWFKKCRRRTGPPGNGNSSPPRTSEEREAMLCTPQPPTSGEREDMLCTLQPPTSEEREAMLCTPQPPTSEEREAMLCTPQTPTSEESEAMLCTPQPPTSEERVAMLGTPQPPTSEEREAMLCTPQPPTSEEREAMLCTPQPPTSEEREAMLCTPQPPTSEEREAMLCTPQENILMEIYAVTLTQICNATDDLKHDVEYASEQVETMHELIQEEISIRQRAGRRRQPRDRGVVDYVVPRDSGVGDSVDSLMLQPSSYITHPVEDIQESSYTFYEQTEYDSNSDCDCYYSSAEPTE